MAGLVATIETRGLRRTAAAIAPMPVESRKVHAPRSITTGTSGLTETSVVSNSGVEAMSSSPETLTTTQSSKVSTSVAKSTPSPTGAECRP